MITRILVFPLPSRDFRVFAGRLNRVVLGGGRPAQADTDLGVPDGDKPLAITDDGSWKVRRINNTPRVTIARSAALGKPKSDPVEAVARVLPKSETRRVYKTVLNRYWYHAWWFYAHSILRGGVDKVHIGLEIKPAA